jgi:hypothetical protein
VYACRGLDMTPGSKAAAANAASQAAQLAALGAATPSGGDAAQITPTSNTMQPLDQPAISSDGEPGSLTGHHHHHHHHRHLLATGNPELPSVWTVSKRSIVKSSSRRKQQQQADATEEGLLPPEVRI